MSRSLKTSPTVQPVSVAEPESTTAIPANEVVSPVRLEEVWSEYVDLLKEDERNAECTVLNQPYELKDQTIVALKLSNSIQLDILERFRQEFVQYLRTSLKNSEISLQTEIVQEETKQKLYTSQDKFNYLVSKNPKLLELKRRLNLDYDY